MKYDLLNNKKKQLDRIRPLTPELVKNLEQWFKVELTYTSNAIEGNTLSRLETAVVIEKGLTVGGKSLVEHLEAKNHAQALDLIHEIQQKKTCEITENDILSIHALILKGIDDYNAGCYRRVAVRISGSRVIMPNPVKVPNLMADFIAWLNSSKDMHPVQFAGEAHYRLVTIHPFSDGNGRTARLLMNLILIMAGYPPAIIRLQERLPYITSLETAQLGGSKEAYEKIIFNAVNRSLDIYLKAANSVNSSDVVLSEKLLRIGKLAKAVNETVSTIRFWTKEGLLEIADVTKSRYQLYSPEMIEQCIEIQRLKTQKLTLNEIKDMLVNNDTK
ncbi:Fic family protein [Candidatus Tisiphia endosymbiont of Melanophora roralis]|jgi:Fic family protein|uniref:Fic family protein n=1 Tax=Candidatus Tisiphia endosymbiont of Melanophora roralis TaxID=3066261 RepID=UPI001E729258|nr:MAG: Fic family protein [Rickettsia endosymbiont of Cimex lectularius]